MKLTKSALKELIKEELENLQEFSMDDPAGDVPAVADPEARKSDYIQQMEEDIRSNTDDIQEIFRVLKKKGIYRPGF